MVKKFLIVLLVAVLLLAAYLLSAHSARPCVVDGIPEPCWSCGSCPALSEIWR